MVEWTDGRPNVDGMYVVELKSNHGGPNRIRLGELGNFIVKENGVSSTEYGFVSHSMATVWSLDNIIRYIGPIED